MTIAARAHLEIALEDWLEQQLVRLQGYRLRRPDDYDPAFALDRGMVVEFLRTTQPEQWQKLEQQYRGGAENTLFTNLERALKERGTLDVLRNGIRMVPGIHFALCFFKPASGLNPDIQAKFDANILSLIRQVRYSRRNGNAIDVVLFVNGIPVATIELKNELTGSTFKTAEQQYKADRLPTGEPLLTFRRGALVHFAMDERNVSMTIKLDGSKTKFLPFNRGLDGGAGNPIIEGDFPVSHMWRWLWSRDVWLDVIGRFLHKESHIYPRFHQIDAVHSILRHARAHGPGQNYLIQHSAGSGKSNTIAWTAHRLATLHDEHDRPIFRSVIVVTDRVVLDRQLQKTIAGFEPTPGFVKNIDGTSKDLAKAIRDGAHVIVTTIHKFSTESLHTLRNMLGANFAIIIDEAHSSQSGQHAENLQTVLGQVGEADDGFEGLIAEVQRQRGPQDNLSYFAFTATPRHVTLQRFGTHYPLTGKPQAFHIYSMRQAIEEGFILDVLKNYTTYKAYWQLEQAIEEDPVLKGRKAKARIAKFATLHPHSIAQKVEVIVEHFRRHVMRELEGQAKAMVVTSSRQAALRYWRSFKEYIAERGYQDVDALVAFSGDLSDGEDGPYTEVQLNGFGEEELPERFAGGEYQVLIVAEKYQTGFDQPLLVSMYVDKALSGLQAVQTLSRLNRTYPGKERTFILDFVNTVEEIQAAFKHYYEATELEETTDPNRIYDLRASVLEPGFIDHAHIEDFSRLFHQPEISGADRARMQALVRSAVDLFRASDEKVQDKFRQAVKSYKRFYSFLGQILYLDDPELEKLYDYMLWLDRSLPRPDGGEDIEITPDMLELRAHRLVLTGEADASLQAGDTTKLPPIARFGVNSYTDEEEVALSDLIRSFNERFGTAFEAEDFVQCERAVGRIVADEEMRARIRNNPPDVVMNAFSTAFMKEMIALFQRDQNLKTVLMTEKDAREQMISFFFSRALRQVQRYAVG